jgi:hypothetical protein
MYDGHVRIIFASPGNLQESRRFALGFRHCYSHLVIRWQVSVELVGGGTVHFCPSGSVCLADHRIDAVDVHLSLKCTI